MPKPVLQAMVLADHVYQDRRTGKHIVAGTFTQFHFRKQRTLPTEVGDDGRRRAKLVGPVEQAGSPYLYLALVEVHGEVPLQLKLVDLSDASIILEAEVLVAATDPLHVAEFAISMPKHIYVHRKGVYSLDVLYDDEILGSWRILAIELANENESEQTGVTQ